MQNKSWLIQHQQQLSALYNADKLPHALLVTGIANSGKQDLASWLVKAIACQHPNTDESGRLFACQQCKSCSLFASQTYPDHLDLIPSGRSISVDEVRQGNQFFDKTAQIGEVKTLLIPEAEKMTVAASNALLKTLEEPNGRSVIVLLSEDVDALLPTIISRCRMINIRPPVAEALFDNLGVSSNKDEFANLTHLPELTDHAIEEAFTQFKHSLVNYIAKGIGRIELLKQLNESPYAVRWIEKVIVGLVREKSGWKSNNSAGDGNVNNIKLENLLLLNKMCIERVKKLKTLNQVNQSLEFEALLVDINRVITARSGA